MTTSVEPSRLKNVYEAFSAVMSDVRAIEKTERNQQQGFTFRGIDSVMQIVGPVLRTHGVFIVPSAENITSESYQTKGGTMMQNVTVTMRYTVYGPAGDKFEGVTFGQSADAGDKAVTKAQSVAYRTFLLQALTVPTGDPDPDQYTHERAASEPAPQSDADVARFDLLTKGSEIGWNGARLADRFKSDYGKDIRTADAGTIRGFTAAIVSEAESQDAKAAT